MNQPSRTEATQMLLELKNGKTAVLDQLAPLIYHELQRIASNYLKQESRNATIQTIDLVHEAYLRLIDESQLSWENRAHFFAVASRAMRQFLIYYANKKKAQKRGGNAVKLSLDEGAVLAEQKSDVLLALDEALTRLGEFDNRMSRVVELRYFSGLTVEETAEVLNISTATVKREWATAKAWLWQELQDG
ncbi:MAG: ECF-type sigma factor [Calditrichota bacterium]